MNSTTDFKSLPLAARWTIVLFGAAGLAALLYATAVEPVFTSGRTIVLLGLGIGCARVRVNLFKGSTLSLLASVVLFAVIGEGPAAAILVGLCGVAAQMLFPSKKVLLHQLAFNAGMIALTITASWLTYHALIGSQMVHSISSQVTAALLSAFTYFMGNSVSVSIIVGLTRGISLFHIWFHHFLLSAPSFLMAGALSLGAIAMVAGASSFMLLSAVLSAVAVGYYFSFRMSAQPR